MLIVKPKLATRALQLQDAGSLVQFDGVFAFVMLVDQGQELSLAAFDSGTKAFLSKAYDGREALTFGNELVLEADLSKPLMSMQPDFNVGTTIFLKGDDPHLVVRRGQSEDWRLLNLRDGKLGNRLGNSLPVLTRWRLGVPVDDDSVAWLLHGT